MEASSLEFVGGKLLPSFPFKGLFLFLTSSHGSSQAIKASDHITCNILGPHLLENARALIFGDKENSPTKENAQEASRRRTIPLLTIYVMSLDDDRFETLAGVFVDVPSRLYRLKQNHLVPAGLPAHITVDVAAVLRGTSTQIEGAPCLVFYAGSVLTYCALDANGRVFDDGVSCGLLTSFVHLGNSLDLPDVNSDTLVSACKEMIDSGDKLDGPSSKDLPLEKSIVRQTLRDISLGARHVIKHFVMKVTEEDTQPEKSQSPAVVVAGRDVELLEKILSNDHNGLMPQDPSIGSYKIMTARGAVAQGVSALLAKRMNQRDNEPTSTLDSFMIGRRVAREFTNPDEDLERFYRGTVITSKSTRSGTDFLILYDDNDSEQMDLVDLHGEWCALVVVGRCSR